MDHHDVTRAARATGDSPFVTGLARVGFAANGVVHLLIGWLAWQVAWGVQRGSADQQGALATVSQTSLGQPLLWVAVGGFAALALWQVTEAILRHQTRDRVRAAAKAVVYLVLAWTTLQVARGSGSGSSGNEQSQDLTASLLGKPAGQVLVGGIGLAVVAVGGYHIVKGIRGRFLRDLRDHPGAWAVWAGRIGYVARGAALVVVGVLFVVAAVTRHPEESSGLDGALRQLLELPFGPYLLSGIALGFAAFGVYLFARARYARL